MGNETRKQDPDGHCAGSWNRPIDATVQALRQLGLEKGPIDALNAYGIIGDPAVALPPR